MSTAIQTPPEAEPITAESDAPGASGRRERFPFGRRRSTAHLRDLRPWQRTLLGENSSGQLGDSTRVDREAPKTVAGSGVYESISAGEYFTCALAPGGASYGCSTNFSASVALCSPTYPGFAQPIPPSLDTQERRGDPELVVQHRDRVPQRLQRRFQLR